MTIPVSKTIQEAIKTQKLNQLSAHYYELKLDLVSLQSVGDTEGAKQLQDRMDKIETSYNAISVVEITE